MVWWAEHFGELGVRNFEAVEREGEETDRKQSKKPKRNKRERECVCDFRVLERERERETRELLKWLSLVKKRSRIECYL